MKFSEKQIKHIKKLASLLIDDGENGEYTRGICELIADIDGIPDVHHQDRTAEVKIELLNN